MRAPNVLAIGALVTLLGFGRAAGQNGEVSSSACCLQLLAPIGARALALGDAVGARMGFGSLHANPALGARLGEDMFAVHTARNAVAETNAFAVLIHSEIIGLIGISYRLIDFGEIESTDDIGNPIGQLKLIEHALTASYATTIAPGLNAGLSYQIFQFRQDCRGFCNGVASQAATTHLVDAGIQFTPSFVPKLELGASVLHLGFPLQVKNAEQSAPTPARLRLAAAHEVLQHVRPDSALQLWLGADLLVPVREPGATILNAGAEISLQETIFVWLGYGGGEGLLGGAAVGIGIEYDRFSVAVARSFVQTPIEGSEPFQLTFGIRF